MIQGKVWGTTKVLLKTPLIELHEILVDSNSFCSLHKHEFKWNGFYVLEGQIYIEVHKNSYDLVDITELNKGDFTTIKPGEFHKFYTKDSTAKVIEVYYPEDLSEDIVRKTVGGTN